MNKNAQSHAIGQSLSYFAWLKKKEYKNTSRSKINIPENDYVN